MTIVLKGGFTTEDRRLDRLPPPDFDHVDKYPLQALPESERPSQTPVVAGVSWYSAFDGPEQDSEGYWWIGRDSNLGHVRGGHLVCLRPFDWKEPRAWWDFYNQGKEGACVGYGCSRMMSLLNRKRYAAIWLYHEAQKIDPWEGGSYEGASPRYAGTDTRSALDVLRERGHRASRGGKVGAEQPGHGIAANRWATSADDVLASLGATGQDWAPMLNSWGRIYPQIVRVPATVLDRLLREDGEFGIVTDR